MQNDFIITKHSMPIIQYKTRDGLSYLQECQLDVPMTMKDLIRLAGDEAEIIGILEPRNFKEPYREVTEEVAAAYIADMAGSGELLTNMPIYVQRSEAGAAYDDEPRYCRPRFNSTYQTSHGSVA